MIKRASELSSEIEKKLSGSNIFKQLPLTIEDVYDFINENRSALNGAFTGELVNLKNLTNIFEPLIDSVANPPECGWLKYAYEYIINLMYPGKIEIKINEKEYGLGRMFIMEILRAALEYEKQYREFSPVLDMPTLTSSETSDCVTKNEYRRFVKTLHNNYMEVFYRIGSEITPYNTLGHVAGVYNLAIHIGKQLIKTGAPVDIALLAGAAAGHDIGKFGCTGEESKRVPYLHYYYTDEYLKKIGAPQTAHIASNHSTWDLELENLSSESLILIYSDFRVKSIRHDGHEEVQFYTLKDAFDVILNKLDNVDEVKKKRYIRVYNKLKDFEDYMINLGINTELGSEELSVTDIKETSLLNSKECVERIKFMAIDHNITLMSIFNDDAKFGNLLESAGSESQWKNLRVYIDTIEEYYTYMTLNQKRMTIAFLFELLAHREGDIRRQSASLIGNIIATFDAVYRKELPAGVKVRKNKKDSHYLWSTYLRRTLYPDYKNTDQQKRWIGYTLKLTLRSLMNNTKTVNRESYLNEFIAMLGNNDFDELSIFALLVTLLDIPLDICSEAQIHSILKFAEKAPSGNSTEIELSMLQLINYILEFYEGKILPEYMSKEIKNTLDEIPEDEDMVAACYLKYKITLHISSKEIALQKYGWIFKNKESINAELFRDNLKVKTPWVKKIVNIEFLLESMNPDMQLENFHIATHLSNLLKVSEIVTVRHLAGNGLVKVSKLLPFDQRNELAVELFNGLEIGEYQYSKYIPKYLGAIAMHQSPDELDELLVSLGELMESGEDKIMSVTIDTLGEILTNYPSYMNLFHEDEKIYNHRKVIIAGMLLKGMGNYHESINQEAFMIISKTVFSSSLISMEEKDDIFSIMYKKMLTLITATEEIDLSFYTNAAALNHVYRYISDHIWEKGEYRLHDNSKVAFFPGTFDPFSLSHKTIAAKIVEMGFDVYLAIDEFSWSKKTQPSMIRKKIAAMSVANEPTVFIYPENRPVNIANESDIQKLKSTFSDKELYIVMGSDVVENASSYSSLPSENSVHSLNHIIFMRESSQHSTYTTSRNIDDSVNTITGKTIILTLPVHLEDISSTRIRNNIDNNRDISNLIDPVCQNFIYENNLYLRTPQYKDIATTKDLEFSTFSHKTNTAALAISSEIEPAICRKAIAAYIQKDNVKVITIRDYLSENKIIAMGAGKYVDSADLFQALGDVKLASSVRNMSPGKTLIIGAIHGKRSANASNTYQLILSEILAAAVRDYCTYAVYSPVSGEKIPRDLILVLERQGFRQIKNSTHKQVYAVDMKSPVVLLQNMDTVLKAPFNTNKNILKSIAHSQHRMQIALTEIYPGELVLSISSSVMFHKLISMITKENGVSEIPSDVRKLGPYMCVPFGKILKNVAISNTVTKTLHTEKRFAPDIKSFEIVEYPYYSSLSNQIKIIKSFNKPAILVDDILHKGYRIKALDPLLRANGIETKTIMVGILSAHGKDLMAIQKRKAKGAYFIPDLQTWFVESSQYPFIGGDGIKRSSNKLASINMIQPYVSPPFLRNADKKALYHFSYICLENTRDILKVIEEEYQIAFQKKLTLGRIAEAVISPKLPDEGNLRKYNPNLAASIYVENAIEKLERTSDN